MRLRSAQRSMLRRICGGGRRPDEDYIAWIQCATHKSLDYAGKYGVKEWVEIHFRKKWQWAGHVARRPGAAWTWKATTWRDSQWQSWATDFGASRPLRPSRRRHMKWEHNIQRFCEEQGLGSWTQAALARNTWHEQVDMFVSWATTPFRKAAIV